MADVPSPTYNNGLYTPWTPSTSDVIQATTIAVEATTAEVMTSEWTPRTTSTSEYVATTTTTTPAWTPPSTTTTSAWTAPPTTALPPPTTTTTTAAATTPMATAASATSETSLLLSPSASDSTSSRTNIVISGPTPTPSSAFSNNSSSNSSNSSGSFKVTYLIPLFIFLPFALFGLWLFFRDRRRRRTRRGDGYDEYDEEGGGLIVGGKNIGDTDEYSEKSSMVSVQRRPSRWNIVGRTLGRRARSEDDRSEVSSAPSLPFRAVSYSSLHPSRPEDGPFEPPTDARAVDFNKYFNALPPVDERDLESGGSAPTRYKPTSRVSALAETAIDTSKWMLGGWGWNNRKQQDRDSRFDSARSGGSNRIPSPSMYSPQTDLGAAYAGLDADEDVVMAPVDLDAYLGESRVGDSSLASRYLDTPKLEPYRDDYRLPASSNGPRPMPRPEISIDMPTAPRKTFASPTKKSAVLPASDHSTTPVNAGLLFKYESPATAPTRNVPTPSSPRPPLPTPPGRNKLGSASAAYRGDSAQSGVAYPASRTSFEASTSEEQPRSFVPPSSYQANRAKDPFAAAPPPLRKKPSRDLFAQSVPEPEPRISFQSGTIAMRKKKSKADLSTPPIVIDFGETKELTPLKHPSKVKSAIYDLEERTRRESHSLPGSPGPMSHGSPGKHNANVGKLLLARSNEARSSYVEDDDGSVYSVDESVIADRKSVQTAYSRGLKDERPLSNDGKRLNALLMARRASLPQAKTVDDE